MDKYEPFHLRNEHKQGLQYLFQNKCFADRWNEIQTGQMSFPRLYDAEINLSIGIKGFW